MNRSFPVKSIKGFTLLELLVALVLIGIILSFATLSFDSGEDRRIKEEANRFYGLIKLAQEESILNDRELTLEIDAKGYRFNVITANGEVSLADPVFRSREFAEFVNPSIKVEQNIFSLDPEKEENSSAAIKIYILSSGELTPFHIEFPAADKRYEIIGSMQGTVEMLSHDKGS